MISKSGIKNTENIFSDLDNNDQEIDLKDITFALLRRRKLAVVVSIIVFLISCIYTLNRRVYKPIYKGSFSILIKDPISTDNIKSGNSFYSDLAINQLENDTSTLIKFLKSPILLKKLSDEEKINPKSLSSKISITVGKVGRSNADGVINISYLSRSRTKGKRVLEKLSKLYLNVALEQKQQRINDGLKFLNSQAPAIQEKKRRLQEQLAEFREKYFILEPGLESISIKEKQKDLENQIISLNLERGRLINLKEGIKKGDYSVQSFEEEIGNQGIMTVSDFDRDLSNQLLSIEKRLSEAKSRYIEKSEVVFSLEKKLAFLKPTLISNQLKSVDSALKLNQNKIITIESQLTKIKDSFQAQPELIKNYNNIDQELNLANQNLLSLTVAKEQFQFAMAQESTPWKLLSNPTIGSNPVLPSIPRNLSLGLVAGVILGSLIAIIRDRFDHVFHAPQEVASSTKQPLLGAIPYISLFKQIREEKQNVLSLMGSTKGTKEEQYERFFYQEAFRNLYTSLRFLNSDSKISSIAMTSSLPSEGKSLINILLAKTLSETGEKILLIDADLRKPQLHTRLGLNNLKGFSNLLTNTNMKTNEVIQKVPGSNNWSVITAGIKPPDPTRLFSSKRMKEINDELTNSDEFDIILYDTPPIIGLSDAALLSENTDGMILLVSLNRVDRSLPQQAINRIKSSGVNFLGCVTNAIKKTKISSSAYSYGGYGYAEYQSSSYATYAVIEDNKDDQKVIEEEKNSIKNRINQIVNLDLFISFKNKFTKFIKWLDS